MNLRQYTIAFAFGIAFAQGASARPELPAYDPVTIEVAGTIEERVVDPALRRVHGLQVTSFDSVTGGLSGSGLHHEHSSEMIDKATARNMVATRVVFTNDGDLFLSERGERTGTQFRFVSQVTGGTGIFAGATGQLVLEGVAVKGLGVRYRYAGAITFVQ